MQAPELLFGHFTYRAFHAYWPHQKTNPFTEVLNNTEQIGEAFSAERKKNPLLRVSVSPVKSPGTRVPLRMTGARKTQRRVSDRGQAAGRGHGVGAWSRPLREVGGVARNSALQAGECARDAALTALERTARARDNAAGAALDALRTEARAAPGGCGGVGRGGGGVGEETRQGRERVHAAAFVVTG